MMHRARSSDARDVFFITGHSVTEATRVSIHFMQLAAAERGHRVTTLVSGKGPAQIYRDRRAPVRSGQILNDLGIDETSPISLFAPIDLRRRWANHMVAPFLRLYGRALEPRLLDRAKSADLILVESGSAVPYLQALATHRLLDRTIYFAADDLRAIRGHPVLQDILTRHAPEVRACVSFGAHEPPDAFFRPDQVVIVPKGIDTHNLRLARPTPFTPGSVNVVSVGNMLIDEDVLKFAARLPDITFHFIGRITPPEEIGENVKLYGVLPFEETVAYLQHAHAGLLPYRSGAQQSYLKTSSLKMAQFKALGLPIVGPEAFNNGDPGYCSFEFSDFASFAAAVKAAIATTRPVQRADAVVDYRDNWAEIEQRFLP